MKRSPSIASLIRPHAGAAAITAPSDISTPASSIASLVMASRSAAA